MTREDLKEKIRCSLFNEQDTDDIMAAVDAYAQTLLQQTAVDGSLQIAVKSIRSNFQLWRKDEIKDGSFSWHLQNNLLRIEKSLTT